MEKEKYTELDKQLQVLAAGDWDKFVSLVGKENIQKAKVCILRQKGQSYTQIAIKLNKSRRSVQITSTNKCNCGGAQPQNP